LKSLQENKKIMDKLTRYYEKAFLDAGPKGSIYTPWSVLEKAGNDRKNLLLGNLPIPNLSNSTVVDYGVGSWGFGCVFPKLKECNQPIGVDVSKYAIDCSARIAERDPALNRKSPKFITSTGYDIGLEDQTIDLFFAGECIEHIEDTESFLSEIYRVLKLNGIVIFTTPNEKPYLYRQLGLKWAMGFEHVALMDSQSLIDSVSKFFSIEVLQGYCSSITPELDVLIQGEEYASEVARLCLHNFHDATGLIVQARKTTRVQPPIHNVFHQIVESELAIGHPNYKDLCLYEETNGRMPIGEDCYLSIPIPDFAIRCQLIMWSHPWSGYVRIYSLSGTREVDLYSHVSGCCRISLLKSDLEGMSMLKVEPTGVKNQQSQGLEVIFFRAVFACDINKPI
jgi:ubiquinone/menaquinone biosynthesis C-methylase UbiE